MFKGQEEKKSVDLWLPDGARFIVVSDCQVPFEDTNLLRNIFGVFAPWYKRGASRFDLFLTGDVMDNYSLSRFPPRVTPLFTLEQEVEATKAYLTSWRKKFDNVYYAFGNHEDRWDREIYNNAPSLAFATSSLAEVLTLDALGIQYVPYLRHFNANGFVFTHGDIVRENTAAAMLANYSSSGTSGHVNRPHSFTKADARDGEPNTWYCTGMTCRMDIGDYIKDWRRIQPWQQGFGIGEVHNGRVHFQLVRVHGGSYYAAGKMFNV